MRLADGLRELLGESRRLFPPGAPLAAELDTLEQKLDGPLQVAIAGRMKAGKSTLLNAFVGERIAPTDAGECTRIITRYEFADEYRVHGELVSGQVVSLPFMRGDRSLEIDLSAAPGEVQRLSVGWPSARLRTMTLVDTPGLDSPSRATERDLRQEADAVVYLVRHLHRTDVAFLEAFRDGRTASPVNAIAVLSRADEIGAGRSDALQSARRIAERYAREPGVRSLASAVVSVVGLLAETAATLEEAEASALRSIASEETGVRERLLLSVDSFREPGAGPLTVGLREALLARLGLFGIRLSVERYVAGEWSNATELARLLTRESGFPEVRDVIQLRFGRHRRLLVARSVLRRLRELSESGALPVSFVSRLEKLEDGVRETAELDLLELAFSGAAGFSPAECEEAARVTGEGTPAARAGCDDNASLEEVRNTAVAAVARWRERGTHPLADRATVYCAETMARCYEALYASTP